MLNRDDLDASILITSKNKFAIPKIVNNFKNNKSKHEIIIVGPMSNYNVGNLKIINSYNKPPQCHTIAFKEARGKFISFYPDDIFFNKKRSLDKLINLTKKNKKKLISARLSNPLNQNINSYRFHPEIKDSKLIPLAPLLDKEIIKKVGLFDTRFTATLYDVDLYLRLMKCGYKVTFSNIYLTENFFNKYSLNQDYSSRDRKLLNSLWTKKTFKGQKSIFGDKIYLQMRNNRADKLQKYNLHKLKKPQGNLGRWKFNNQIFFFLANRLYFFIFKIILNTPNVQSKLYYIYRKYFKSKFQK
tara:strand:- start:30798 stop:31697 length:900 start_codon:yes stop_codon:yes gene_type:complete